MWSLPKPLPMDMGMSEVAPSPLGKGAWGEATDAPLALGLNMESTGKKE